MFATNMYASGVMSRKPSPVSRRDRPAKPALTRDGIVAAAVRVMSAQGIERVTMRRLAQELDTGAASLYVYLRNTAELKAAVLDEMLGAVDLRPGGSPGEWRDRLAAVLTSYGLVLFQYPTLAQSALVARPSGPNYLKLLDCLLGLLAEGGVPTDRAAWGVDLLLQFVTATSAEHSNREQAINAQLADGTLVAALDNLATETYPNIAAAGAELLSGDGRQRLAWGYGVLITGIARTPRPKSGQVRPRPQET